MYEIKITMQIVSLRVFMHTHTTAGTTVCRNHTGTAACRKHSGPTLGGTEGQISAGTDAGSHAPGV